MGNDEVEIVKGKDWWPVTDESLVVGKTDRPCSGFVFVLNHYQTFCCRPVVVVQQMGIKENAVDFESSIQK